MPDERVSKTRPVIFGRIVDSKPIPARRGGGGRAQFSNPDERFRRIDARFDEASAALGDQVRLVESIHAADPQLVLVFEALDEQIDLSGVVEKLGVEILMEAEDAIEPSDEFQLRSDKPRNPFIASCLHAVCTDQKTFGSLLSLWRTWKTTQHLPHGYSKLRDLFAHLKDVRPWGPQDRLGSINWDDYFAGHIDDRLHSVEIELWYRRSSEKRQQSQQEVATLIETAGGHITTSAIVDQVGYHGLKCMVPTQMLRDLAAGDHEAVRLVRSAHVMYLRIVGQSLPVVAPPIESQGSVGAPLPDGDPVLCLLDGVPAANHPLLQDRVVVFDPDDLANLATVEELRHGTWMSSVAVWGDLAGNEGVARRPVLVRPVLTPANDTINRDEELPPSELVPDLMWRTFRELFDGTESQPAAAPSITVVNISIGDPAAPFDTIMSSWARIIDWLSYEYGVLVIVSAGNHPYLELSPATSADITRAVGSDRRLATLEAVYRRQNQRRLLAPAESVNAVSVGAIHGDESLAVPQGYAIDPADGLPSISPISPSGSGYRRSIKPDLAANGGRVFFREGITPQDAITFAGLSSIGPGIRVATPAQFQETHIAGTSPAAALMSRRAARLHDVVEQITAGEPLTRRQRASAIKALLVHGTSVPDNAVHAPLAREVAFGNGAAVRDLADGCATNEAVILYVGSIGANEEQELLFPLPDGLSVRETKRIDATLVWLTPVNWRHRQYRRAALSFVKPAGSIPALGTPNGVSSDASMRGATTVQHQSWEFEKALASGQGSNMAVRVKCYEQAGGLLGERIDFAVALSLWVAPALNIDVYSQVRAQVETRVAIRPQQ
ncbi:S8 family peptidase [Raineyella sp. LH-20]|uniref:S8 family peptidase n=1 Tax=Raineyella sp. LH-20 TaxID=3081204 RepID=UPI002955A965|nr:S8 family peptidase [Raineyella sp. LH-20]WOP17371.1 S8 family peptidase [Raineyella sp. LH-20]